MRETCKSCGSEETVPVLDVKLTRRPGGGNPYRARCLACSSRYGTAGKVDWANHSHPHVLPRTADPGAEHPTIPLSEYDDRDDLPDYVEDAGVVLDRAEELRDEGREFEVVDPVQEDDVDEDPEPETVNRFDCPGCGAEVEGKPDECPGCGAPYQWT